MRRHFKGLIVVSKLYDPLLLGFHMTQALTPYLLAATIDCVCDKMLNNGLYRGVLNLLFKVFE